MAKLRSQHIRDPNARLQRIESPGSHHTPIPLDQQIRVVRDVLLDLWSISSFFIEKTDGSYQTTGAVSEELVLCGSTATGTQTITLHKTPNDHAKVTVKRVGTAPVTIVTEGSETIDGAATKAIGSQYDAVQLMYTDCCAEWSIIN